MNSDREYYYYYYLISFHHSLQFKLPDEIVEQFKSASNEEGKLQAIEKYANDLPIVTRTYIAGKIFLSSINAPSILAFTIDASDYFSFYFNRIYSCCHRSFMFLIGNVFNF